MLERARRSFAALRGEDEGITLLEVIVALGLLVVLAVGVASSLLVVQKSGLNSKERSAAANLAQREVEVVRNWFHSSDTAPLDVMNAGDTTNGSPLPGQTGALVVDSVPYTVKRSVSWLVAGAGQSACDGGSVVSYPSVGVHVEVTWPNMGETAPVVSDTILTPPKNVLTGTYGYIAVKVLNRRGTASVGRNVRAVGPAGTFNEVTDGAGCATFVLGTAGTYTVSMMDGGLGYISFNGSTSQSIPVTAGSITVRSFTYDLGVSYAVTLAAPGGYDLPQSLPAVTFGNAGILPAGVASFASAAGGTTTVGPLWPFVSGYSIWAGSCTDSDPALDPAGRPAALTPRKGTTTPATATLTGVSLRTVDMGDPVSAQVTATYAGSGACAAGDATLVLGTSDATGALYTSLPLGRWNLSIPGDPTPTLVDVDAGVPVSTTVEGGM